MEHYHSSPSKKMVRLSNFLSLCFCFNQFVKYHDIGSKMERNKERLDVVANEKDRYHFDLDGKSGEPERQEATPLFDVSRETESLGILPHGIGRLSNLRTLSKFSIGENGEGCNVGELKNLNHLRGHLEISGLGKVPDVNEVTEANLKNKEHLRSLDLAFSFGVQEVITNVIEALQPHPNLEVLLVYDYGGSIFPSWMTLLTKLKDLKLLSCFLGRYPVTDQDSVTESIILFPKLKELTFRCMVEWENWDTTTTSAATTRTMPYLRSLSLYDCPELKSIPEDLKQRPLEELSITRLYQGLEACSTLVLLTNPLSAAHVGKRPSLLFAKFSRYKKPLTNICTLVRS
ncbi:unnamed protein product [Dovyalis caffra]|uniref:R13L1/DRL21-like LRR repeat region domain-containing protein n=1 Tax=Dovyalis caffra TaxID=77055 RepID=A0AAV1RFQ6_9ROSI|nr:unnamed protein product [Dovyalis caffra]